MSHGISISHLPTRVIGGAGCIVKSSQASHNHPIRTQRQKME
jgi:hypothetical protein